MSCLVSGIFLLSKTLSVIAPIGKQSLGDWICQLTCTPSAGWMACIISPHDSQALRLINNELIYLFSVKLKIMHTF